MALRHQDGHAYGDAQADIREELGNYGDANGYPIHHFADAVCRCGARLFFLDLDETAGVAVRICDECGHEHLMGDGAEFLENAEFETCECLCGSNVFEITAGVSLFANSDDVRWLYLGCRCVVCGLTGCFGDWKNEYKGYRELLARI